jgi:hypothetical protein
MKIFLCHLVPEFSKLMVLCIVPPFEECDSVVSANLEKFKLFQFWNVYQSYIIKTMALLRYNNMQSQNNGFLFE